MVEAGSRGVEADGRARKRKLDAGRTSRQNVEALNLFFSVAHLLQPKFQMILKRMV